MKELPLTAGWQLARTPPGACPSPRDLAATGTEWHEAIVPGTVASVLHRDLDTPGHYDADDWWYRTTFARPAARAGARFFLRLDGLATLAEVWLNGQRVLESRNMFVGHRLDVTALVRDVNQLAIRFASLDAALQAKRPRPRWKTALVEAQNLRWFRTTLLGRMPGWSPPVAPVGPWQPVSLEWTCDVDVAALQVHARLQGRTGFVNVRATVNGAGEIDAARLVLGERTCALNVVRGPTASIEGEVAVDDPPRWWPHTHGEPALVPWTLELRVEGVWLALRRGRLGFRDVRLEAREGEVRFHVNGEPMFLRGACWTTTDILALRGERECLREALETARAAGANLLRVGGTMVYESDDFYALCDELGLAVWQDFMFANMDYPFDDRDFRGNVDEEVRAQLQRLQSHACVVAYCGGSEVAQQAAMRGVPAADCVHEFFSKSLPELCASYHPGVPYFPSTPWGGALPFHVGSGIAHYYGVGAYRRPLEDVKLARVRFATECLAFSNVPEAETIRAFMPWDAPPPHHPKWKARVPRDHGSGWDFEDIRDHYMRTLFRLDPVELRSQDLPRYYAIGRAVTAEVMRRVFAEWRSPASGCGGALVWFYRDLAPGAGWGIVDALGRPKSAWWALKRAWAPRSIHLTDQGLDGLAVHVVNEPDRPLDATVEVSAYRHGHAAIAPARARVPVNARSTVTRAVDAIFGRFTDLNHAYRFGPAVYDVIGARLVDNLTGVVLGEDFLFPQGWTLPQQADPGVRVEARARDERAIEVEIESDVFLQSVAVSAAGFLPDDNYFHLAPGVAKRLLFTATAADSTVLTATFEALNAAQTFVARASLAERQLQP